MLSASPFGLLDPGQSAEVQFHILEGDLDFWILHICVCIHYVYIRSTSQHSFFFPLGSGAVNIQHEMSNL